MKTIPTIATAILAIFLVLAPAVAFGAAVTVKTDSASYTGTTSIHVSGQVTPPPTTNTAVTLTTMNPSKQVVDIGIAGVSQVDGTYSYTLVPGGTAAWVSGTYTINAVTNNATASTTFGYTPTSGGGGSGAGPVGFALVHAASPLLPGQTISVIVTSSALGAATASYWAPGASAATSLGAATRIAGINYAYAFSAALPAGAASGVYLLTASVTNSTTNVAIGTTGEFTVNGGLASAATDAAIGANVTKLATTVASMQATLGTISTGVTSANSGITQVNTNLGGLAGAGAQLTALNSAIANNQTYVLVVAALAAITLVLELAILVRKLS